MLSREPLDTETEQLLLIATVEDLLLHEVSLREDSDGGVFLVFPTEGRHKQDLPPNLGPWRDAEFEGPVQHVWAPDLANEVVTGLNPQRFRALSSPDAASCSVVSPMGDSRCPLIT